MKILHLTDVHEDLEALTSAVQYGRKRNVDVVFCTGDLLLEPYTIEGWTKYLDTRDRLAFREHVLESSRKKYRKIKGILDTSKAPYFVIPGNYDTSEMGTVFGRKNIHNRAVNIDGLVAAGYGGAEQNPDYITRIGIVTVGVEPYKEIFPYFNDGALAQLLEEKKPNIILSHTPPYGMLDCTIDGTQWGSPMLRRYILGNHSDLLAVFCGHVHESGPLGKNPQQVMGAYKQGTTIISNAGNLGRFGIMEKETMKDLPKLERGTLGWGTFAILGLDEKKGVTSIDQYDIKANKPGQVGTVNLLRQFRL